jgi:hypothetical protein
MGRVTLPAGGFVRSNSVYTHGTLEAVAEFGAGTWQHIGFGALDFGSERYILFSTFDSQTALYARVNNFARGQVVSLGPIPPGRHSYGIEWDSVTNDTDRARFFIDGSLVAELTVPALNATNYHVYMSNNGSAPLQVDQTHVFPPLTVGGSYKSCAFDTGYDGTWPVVSWVATVPPGTSVRMFVRLSPDMRTWSAWEELAASGSSPVATGRYLQYRVELATTDFSVTPGLDTIRLDTLAAQAVPR